MHGAIVKDPPPQQVRTADSFRRRGQESDDIETGDAGDKLQPARPVAAQKREESVPGCSAGAQDDLHGLLQGQEGRGSVRQIAGCVTADVHCETFKIRS